MEDSDTCPVKAKRICYSRPHTKEERKQEKKRYRERKKLLKRKEKRQAVGEKVDLGTQTEGPSEKKDSNPAKITVVSRKDLSALDKSNIIGSGTCVVCYKGYYRGNIPVVIKTFKEPITKAEVTRKADAIQDLQKSQNHASLPLLFGINLDSLPFLLVTQLHCNEDSQTFTLSQAVKDKMLGRHELMDIVIPRKLKESLYSSCLSVNPDDRPKTANLVAVSLLTSKK